MMRGNRRRRGKEKRRRGKEKRRRKEKMGMGPALMAERSKALP